MTIQLDPYEELGLDRRAGSDAIKAAYKALAKTRHPDAGGGAEEWERLQTAYDVLMNPDLRRGYDEDGVIGQVAIDNDRASAVQVIDGKVAEIINLSSDHVIGFMIAVGKAVKPAMPKGGQLALSEVVVQDRFA